MTMKTTFEANALHSFLEESPGETEAEEHQAWLACPFDLELPVVFFNTPTNVTCGSDDDRRASRADDHSRRSYALRRFDYRAVQIVEAFLKTLSRQISPSGGRNREGPG